MKSFTLTAWNIVMRDYRVRFRRTFLGAIWFLLPLISLVGMALFIGKDIGLYASAQQSQYFIQLLTGLIFWQLLADTWLEPMRFGRRAKMVLRAAVFDQRTLLMAGVLSSLIGFMIKIPFLIATLIWFKISPDISAAIYLPLGLASIIMTGVAMASFTLPISLGILDIRYGAPFVQYVFLLTTPLFYPQQEKGLLAGLNQLNPFTYLILPVRDTVIGQQRETALFILAALLSTAFLMTGLIYFRSKIRLAIAYIGR